MAEVEKPQFEREMDAKIARAREAVETKYGSLEDTPAAAELPTPEGLAAEGPEAPPPTPEAPPEPPPAPRPERVVAQPPPPAPAPIEEPPVAVEPPKVEAKPQENFDWKEHRRVQRELRKLEKEMEEMRKARAAEAAAQPPVAPAEQPPPADDDPFGVNRALKEVETLRADADRDRQRYAIQAQQAEQDRLRGELAQQESVFITKQPDYYDAINHMVNFETKRFHAAGLDVMHGNQLLRNPTYAPVIEKIADDYVAVADANNPRGFALVERGRATTGAREISDIEAAQALASDLWIVARRDEVIQSAKASGRAIPEVVWDLAGTMGYQPKPLPSAAVPVAVDAPVPAAPTMSVAEKIRQSAKVSAAGKSLSQASGGMPSEPAQKQFRTLTELMAFRKADPAGYLRYQKEQSAVNPNWHRDLIAG